LKTEQLLGLVSLSSVSLILVSSVAWGQDNISADTSVYQVDAESSDIRVLIHRAGALSWLGHSHVISVGQLDGMIYVYPQLEQSRFELVIPVQGLVVDNPLLRDEEGDEFSTEISERDIARTRRNMLGKRVLNAEQYPIVKLIGTGYRGDKPEFVLEISIVILGHVVEIQVPTTLRLNGDMLEAAGTLRLSHSDLGMRPFTAMLGALRVADEIEFKYRVRAQRAQGILPRYKN